MLSRTTCNTCSLWSDSTHYNRSAPNSHRCNQSIVLCSTSSKMQMFFHPSLVVHSEDVHIPLHNNIYWTCKPLKLHQGIFGANPIHCLHQTNHITSFFSFLFQLIIKQRPRCILSPRYLVTTQYTDMNKHRQNFEFMNGKNTSRFKRKTLKESILLHHWGTIYQ